MEIFRDDKAVGVVKLPKPNFNVLIFTGTSAKSLALLGKVFLHFHYIHLVTVLSVKFNVRYHICMSAR